MNSLRLCGGSAAITATLATKRTFIWRSLWLPPVASPMTAQASLPAAASLARDGRFSILR